VTQNNPFWFFKRVTFKSLIRVKNDSLIPEALHQRAGSLDKYDLVGLEFGLSAA
jgi:hypothetical protein